MIRLKEKPPGFLIIKRKTEPVITDPVKYHRFGRLVSVAVVKPDPKKYHNKTPRSVIFQCDCGKKVLVSILDIRRNSVPESCGKKCPLGPLYVDRKHKRKRGKHRPQTPVFGMTFREIIAAYPKEYRTWCEYKHTYCKRWRNSFEWFMLDMGPRPPGLALNKRNRRRLHGPDNSYWDYFRTDASRLTWQGHKVVLSWVASRFNITPVYIKQRTDKGDTRVEDIIKRWDAFQKRLKEQKQK